MASSRDRSQSDNDSVADCLRRLKSGNPDAARELWDLYNRRLVALARVKLRDMPRRATDEEDIAQSTFQSFCWRTRMASIRILSTPPVCGPCWQRSSRGKPPISGPTNTATGATVAG